MPLIVYTLDMEVDKMTLFEKFKDKTLFITVQNGTLFPTYKGSILKKIEDIPIKNYILFLYNYLTLII